MQTASETPDYTSGQKFDLKRGEAVVCNGHPGTVVEVCDGQLQGMVEVRVPGGVVCVDASYPDVYPAPAPEVLKLRDRLSGGQIYLYVRGGAVVGALGCEPARYVGATVERARHVARYGGRA